MAKKMTMANKVREYTKANPQALAKDIAKALGTKIQYVHSVWYLDRKKKGVHAKKVGRPAKVGRPPKARTLDDILGLPKQTAKDDWQIKSLEGEIANLKAVIRYLEGRIYGAPV
jgi:hypothetical protein